MRPLLPTRVRALDLISTSGDVSIHHGLLLHMAMPNISATTRRRAYVTRWAGDGVTFDPRPGIQQFLDPHIEAGRPLEESELFPVVWREEWMPPPPPPPPPRCG